MKTRFACVTTFAEKHYELYGRRFIESYLKHWPETVPLFVYYEGKKPDIESPRITYIDLGKDRDREKFMAEKFDTSSDYRFQAVRFSHKVFALTDPDRIKNRPSQWWIWLDADIETTSKIDIEFIEAICPEGFVGSYLGRKDWPHSECGFVGYNTQYRADEFLEKFRTAYVTGEIFQMKEWHDSFVFDRLREGWWHNLSADLPGMEVFNASILGTRMRHDKGPVAKKKMKQKRPDGMKGIGAIAHTSAGGMEILVKTKNCVPEENILANVHYSSTLLKDWLVECRIHDGVAVFCSGGPSLKDYYETVRELAKKPNHYVVCVKSAHDDLIAQGIIPWACVLLDPRAHVQDFIENPHPEIRYLVASMCHPTTVDRLIEKKAKVWGYHAQVGAGEHDVVAQRLGDGHFLIPGGCSAAMRGISILHTVGFRRFDLYGYDCCYTNEKDIDFTTLDKRGQPKYVRVTVNGKEFITDHEKIAQCQDIVKVLEMPYMIDIDVHGPGMVPHIWNSRVRNRANMADVLV